MLYVVLAILTGVMVLVIFKLFTTYRVHTFSAIIINYITAGMTGILFSEHPYSLSSSLSSAWIGLSIPLGGLFIFIFYLISQTAQRIGISTASVANKMSVVMPVLFSCIILKQELSPAKIAGILLALVAVYLSSKKSAEQASARLIWLPILVFIGSGLIDVAINASNAWLITTEAEGAHFTISTFLSAFSIGVAALLCLSVAGKNDIRHLFTPKNILAGVVLGIPNYFSIYFIFRALQWGQLSSAQLFPVLNLSNVILSALTALLLFREKLSLTNAAGIVLALLSILLIAL